MTETPLRAYRRNKKMTLREFAVQAGVSEGQLSRIEREGTTSLERALDLARITALPPESFLKTADAA
jgi:transcriptional regulator with XRE-family HTH domain